MRLSIPFIAMSVLALAQPKPEGWPLGARIPAISGQVVDAITDRPVANVDVILRANLLRDSSPTGVLRYENSRTPTTGGFSFPTSLESKVSGFMTSLRGYWLTVNHAYSPAPPPPGQLNVDPTLEDFSWNIARHPLFNGSDAEVNNPAYFPMTIEFVHPCQQMWDANCVRFDDTQNVRIRLIPVLENPAECNQITEPALRESCRQLNTYRAAFLHVETIAEVRADKEQCRKVDQGPIAKVCLESLELYIANPGAFKNRKPLRMEVDPIEKVLILKPIAGMFVTGTMVSHLNPFYETAAYNACYSVDKVRQTDAGCASVWWVRVDDSSDRRFASSFEGRVGYTKGAERTEVVEGNTITTVDLPKLYEAVWSSGTKVVRITFYKAAFFSGLSDEIGRSAVASLEARREMIRLYLAKYPSDH
jgi:hypothetical protein